MLRSYVFELKKDLHKHTLLPKKIYKSEVELIAFSSFLKATRKTNLATT